jgi:hypothetical protein
MIYAYPMMDGGGYDYHIHTQSGNDFFLGLGFRSNDAMIDF